MNQRWCGFLLLVSIPAWAIIGSSDPEMEAQSNRDYVNQVAYPKLRTLRLQKISEFTHYRFIQASIAGDFQSAEIYYAFAHFTRSDAAGAFAPLGKVTYEILTGDRFDQMVKLTPYELNQRYYLYLNQFPQVNPVSFKRIYVDLCQEFGSEGGL